MNRLTQRISGFFRAADGAWAAILLTVLVLSVAIWHVLDYSNEFDPEYPGLQRDHFSDYAPFAYRIAEPGDTLDLIALYLSAIGFGLILAHRFALASMSKPASKTPDVLIAGLLAMGFWTGSAPEPPADGWHGLSYQAIGRAGTPALVRCLLSLFAMAIVLAVLAPIMKKGRLLYRETTPIWRALALISVVCAVWRIAGLPDPEPWGYWPRWAMIVSLVIADVALANRLVTTGQLADLPRKSKAMRAFAVGLSVFAIVQGGFYVHWLHWPIPRLKVVVPGRIYASAMPPPSGLALAYSRHRFKTIINLFNEDTPQRHRDYLAEVDFAAKHGIRYVRADASSQGVDFVRKTLEIARDPDNWPVLVHCHGNMDRTPAWVGIYRFIDLGWSMRDVLAAIERHRGYRPKGGVTVLYDEVLPVLAPDLWEQDPQACQLAEYAREYEKRVKSEIAAKHRQKVRK